MIFDLPPPAILQQVEPWELDLYRKLSPLGLPRAVRHAIVKEFKRLEGSKPSVYKPAFADLAKYGKDPALALLLSPPIGWRASALTLTWIDQVTDATDQTVYNFGDFNAPAAGLMIVVFLASGNASRTISPISIGGTAGDVHIEIETNRKMSVCSRVVSAGNNNVTVTLSGNNGTSPTASANVWLLQNYVSAVPTATASATHGGADATHALVLNISAGGIAVFGSAHQNTNDTTWSAATEREENTIGSSRHAAADYTAGAAETPHTETVTWTSAVPGHAGAASWL